MLGTEPCLSAVAQLFGNGPLLVKSRHWLGGQGPSHFLDSSINTGFPSRSDHGFELSEPTFGV